MLSPHSRVDLLAADDLDDIVELLHVFGIYDDASDIDCSPGVPAFLRAHNL